MRNINVNTIIEVDLNEYGYKVYCDYLNEINSRYKGLNIEPKIKRAGKCKFQLWDLINIFGNSFQMGATAPFMEIIID